MQYFLELWANYTSAQVLDCTACVNERGSYPLGLLYPPDTVFAATSGTNPP